MTGKQFVPNFNANQPKETDSVPEVTKEVTKKDDGAIKMLLNIGRWPVLILFFILPLFFTPKLWATLGFDKVMVAAVAVSVIIVAAGLVALRKKDFQTVLPKSLGIYWLVVLVAYISALTSGDTLDAVRGSVIEVQTVGFLVLMGLVMTGTLVLQGSKLSAMKAVLMFGAAAAVLVTYNVIRLIAGAEFMSFDTFTNVTISPIGVFNDLAIFSGLVIILGLITLIQLPLKSSLQTIVSGAVLASVFLLAVINFFNIWLVVGFFALLVLVYLLSRDILFPDKYQEKDKRQMKIPIIITALVCVVSAVFVISGDYAGNFVGKYVNADYAEVIPSIKGTIGIAKAAYEDGPILGVGPNRFVDAWRIYKDPTINNTPFWDTDFTSGSGYIPTMFVNIGLLGGILLLAFHIMLLYLGYKVLLRSEKTDSYWYYISSVSFAAAFFIWGMSYVYEPSTGVMLIGALFTGLAYVAASVMLPSMVKTVPLVVNQKRGFFMMAVVIIVITNTVITLFSVGKQYSAQASFSESRQTASVEEIDRAASEAFRKFPDDRFMNARAQIQLGKMNSLLGLTEPTDEDRQSFLTAVEQAQTHIDTAINNDPTNPDNHAVLAGIYGGLAVAAVDGAKDRMLAALDEARKYDLTNPGYSVAAAQLATRIGDVELAKTELDKALSLKPNFTQALYLMAQIDISEGNTADAIAITKSIISLEPNNPTRYFQLGMLLAAEANYNEAIVAFQYAIRLDPQYANARYLLALAYVSVDRTNEALQELYKVRETNPDNSELLSLISQLESGDTSDVPELGLETPIEELSPNEVVDDDGLGLVENLNTVPVEEEALEELSVPLETTESDSAADTTANTDTEE